MDENEKLDLEVFELIREKQEADRLLLNIEIVIGVLATILFIGSFFLGLFLIEPLWAKIVVWMFGLLSFAVLIFVALKIEQKAGKYECKKCKHTYTPEFSEILCSAHIGRTRYLKCSKCGKKTWHKKVI